MRHDGMRILLTGPPGCGKTTVVQRLAERLGHLRLAGFYTRELREQGRRVGFEAVGLNHGTVLLAHVRSKSPHRVGQYGVELKAFEPLLEAELDRSPEDVDLFLVDEIGKMECFSGIFENRLQRILDGAVPLVATVAKKGGGFIADVKARSDIELQTVSRINRDELPATLAKRLAS